MNFPGTYWLPIALIGALFSLGLLACTKKEKEVLFTPINLPTDYDFQAIKFLDQDTGYLSGGERYFYGGIWKTTDGGATWREDSATNKIMYDLHFNNTHVGFGTGIDGKVVRTFDGGNHWEKIQTKPYTDLYGIEFVNDSVGFAVGGIAQKKGVLLKTTDAGSTWTSIELGRELRCLRFLNEQVGFVGGWGILMKTEDQGASWDTVGLQGDFFREILFPTASIGYVFGNNGSIFKSEDGGNTWDRLRNGNNPAIPKYYFQAAYFVNQQKGYVVGNHGLLLRTTDGAKSWVRFQRFTEAHLKDVWVGENGAGMVVGENGAIFQFNDNP